MKSTTGLACGNVTRSRGVSVADLLCPCLADGGRGLGNTLTGVRVLLAS